MESRFMTPSISTTLEAFRNELAAQVRSNIFVGAPDDDEPGLYVFPIHHDISSMRPPPNAPAERSRRPGYSLECLMLAAPGEDFEMIDQGATFLHEHPILEIDGTIARLTVSDEVPGETAGIFLAAGISYRLYIRFRIRVEPTRPSA